MVSEPLPVVAKVRHQPQNNPGPAANCLLDWLVNQEGERVRYRAHEPEQALTGFQTIIDVAVAGSRRDARADSTSGDGGRSKWIGVAPARPRATMKSR